MSVDLPVELVTAPRLLRGRNRAVVAGPRSRRVYVRFAEVEWADIVAAAERTSLTPTGYTGEAALAAARAVLGGAEVAAGSTREELARLQRELFAARTALVVAAMALDEAGGAGPEGCVAAVAQVDVLVARVHGLLKRSRS